MYTFLLTQMLSDLQLPEKACVNNVFNQNIPVCLPVYKFHL